MNKNEFFSQLRGLLQGTAQQEIEDIIRDYEEYYELALQDGKQEEEIVCSWGSPKEVAADMNLTPSVHKPDGSNEQPSFFSDRFKRWVNVEDLIINERETVHGEDVACIECCSASANITLSKSTDEHIHLHFYGIVRARGDVEELRHHCRMDMHQKGQALSVEIVEKMNSSRRKLNLDVALPEKQFRNAVLRTASGNVTVQELQTEEASVRTASGNIEISDFAGRELFAGTASGNIGLRHISADLSLKTASGNVEVEQSEVHRVKASTASGNIKLCGVDGRVEITSASGNVHLEMKELTESTDIHVVSGAVYVKVPSSRAFDLQYATVSGDAKIHYPLQVQHKEKGKFYGRAGDGGNKIQVKSVSGDFNLTADTDLVKLTSN